MAARLAPGTLSRNDARQRSNRLRTLTAFLLGLGISGLWLPAFAAERSTARGPFVAADPITFVRGASEVRPRRAAASIVEWEPRSFADAPLGSRRERIALVSAPARLSADAGRFGAQSVCVRLCDGFFFPLAAPTPDEPAAQASACESLCPNSPTEVYRLNGSDRIEDAVSPDGRRYMSLPAALRYRTVSDGACACRRASAGYAPLSDPTLRRGDAVMTPAGMVVFSGAEGGAHNASDFSALSAARLPAGERIELQAMERVSVASAHPSLGDWLASRARAPLAAAAPTLAAARVAKADDRIRLLVWRGGQD